MVKKVLKSSFIGIGAAVIISSIVMMIIDIANGGSLDFQNYQYTKMFFGDLIEICQERKENRNPATGLPWMTSSRRTARPAVRKR